MDVLRASVADLESAPTLEGSFVLQEVASDTQAVRAASSWVMQEQLQTQQLSLQQQMYKSPEPEPLQTHGIHYSLAELEALRELSRSEPTTLGPPPGCAPPLW